MQTRRWHAFYDDGVAPSLEYEDVPLAALLKRAAARYPRQPAIIFENCRLSYRDFNQEVDRLATALAALGVGKGTRVAIQMPNLPQVAVACLAILRLGAVVVMTNPLYMPPEIEHQWNDAGATVAVVLDAIYKAKIDPIRDKLPIEHYVIASIPEYLRFPLNLLAPMKLRRSAPPMIADVKTDKTVHRFRELIRSSDANPPVVEIDMEHLAFLQYTGGTTGVSKGAMLTHRNVAVNVHQCAAWNPQLEEGGETIIGCLPFFHIYGLTVAMLMAVRCAGSLVIIPNPRDIVSIVKAVHKHRATMCPMVPAMFMGVNQCPDVGKYSLSSLKVCNSGSAPLPVEVLHEFERLTGARVTEGYGLSETSPVTHTNPIYGKRKPGSIGVPLADTDAKIVDASDGVTEKGVGEEGELLLKGPQVFPGYWQRPEAAADVLKDGWFYTGDLARVDEDGFHYIVGRKKDMILASGYNVYPDEVDRVLMAHENIIEAATIGVPDPKRGETVKSFVVLAPGASMTEDEIRTYCRENLAAYKVPRLVEFRESLPKSTVLKILRRELRDQETARLAQPDRS